MIPVYDAGTHVLEAELPEATSTSPPFDSVDVSRLPGAKIVALHRFENESAIAFAGCARGSSSRFAPGLEGVLFGRAKDLALGSLQVAVKDLVVTHDSSSDRSFEQVIVGATDRGPLRVHQIITFAGPDRDLLLCSLACAGPGCERAALVIRGDPPEAPPPNVLLRTFLAAAEHPRPVLGAGAAFLLAVVAIILWRRPRPA